MCEANIVGRDFAKDELEYSSGSDSVVSELLDQRYGRQNLPIIVHLLIREQVISVVLLAILQ